MIVLLCGLPGSGKTWLAERLCHDQKNMIHINADKIRSVVDDWEFDIHSRMRQAMRMRGMAFAESYYGRIAIADFVCPTPDTRQIFDADYTIFLDTIDASRFADTNQIFVKPDHADVVIKTQVQEEYIPTLRKSLISLQKNFQDRG